MGILKKQLGLNSVAVIDIGSNSVRCVVYDGISRLPKILFNEKVPCALGKGIELTGLLNEEGVTLSYKSFKRFRILLDQIGVCDIYAFATAAVRDAKDGRDFIEQASALLDTNVIILSGEEEAYYSSLGVVSGYHNPNGFVGDLGGGSLELSYVDGQIVEEGISLPLGGLRLHDKSDGKLNKAKTLVESCLKENEFLNKLAHNNPPNFYLIGGVWRSLAKLHMYAKGYPLNIMHGYRIEQEDARRFLQRIARGDVDHLKGIETIEKKRRYLLSYGAIVMGELVNILHPKRLVFSTYGIREGYLYHLLNSELKKQDALLTFSKEMAEAYARSSSHIYELLDWTKQAFEALGINETETEKRCRESACFLSDIGWRAEVDYRGTQAFDMIAYGSFVGVSHRHRLFVAYAVYYGNQFPLNDGKNSDRLIDLLSNDLHKKAKILGLLLGIAVLLSAFNVGVIPELIWQAEEDKITLVMPQKYIDLMGESLDERFKALQQVVGKEIACEIRN